MNGSRKSNAYHPNYICNIVKNLCFIFLSLLAINSTAEQTIEDHKYLLELVENKAAIAYFAVLNRN